MIGINDFKMNDLIRVKVNPTDLEYIVKITNTRIGRGVVTKMINLGSLNPAFYFSVGDYITFTGTSAEKGNTVYYYRVGEEEEEEVL